MKDIAFGVRFSRSAGCGFWRATSNRLAGGGRNHVQQLHRPWPQQRHRRRACFSLSAVITGDDAAPTVSKRETFGDNARTLGETRFKAMLGMRRPNAAKVDVTRVMQELRDEGAEFNLRTYRGCLAFLAKGGRGREALMYLEEMESAGVAGDNACLGHVATACARGQMLETALAMVRGMVSKGHSVTRTYNNIMLAIVNGQAFTSRTSSRSNFRRTALSNMECEAAVGLLGEMQACGAHPTVFTYNLLIAALTRSRRPHSEVLNLVDQMRCDGIKPDSYTYVGVVKGIQGPNKNAMMRAVLEDAKLELEGLDLSAVYSAVVSGYAVDGSWEDASALVDEMFANDVPRDEYTYCAAMNACKEAGKWMQAAAFLPRMRADGVPPNTIAYNTAIGACAFFGRPNKAWNNNRETSSFMRPTSTRENVGRGLSPVQAEASDAGDFALGLMEEMKREGVEPDIITYGSLMSALSPRGAAGADIVLELFETLAKSGLKPNSITYVSAIRAYGDKGDWKRAEQMLVGMQKEHGVEPNRFCYSAVVKALANGGQWKRALETLDEMRECGLSADPVVYTAAIGACEKFGQWEKALETLSKLVSEKPPMRSLMWGYNAAISALGKAKQMEGIKDLLATMKASGLKPDEYTYAAMMRASGIDGSWEESWSMLLEMERAGVRPNRVVYNTLIASLLKGEQIEKADEILNRMREGGVPPDVTTYTTVMSGCKRESDWRRAEALLSEMDSFGIKPNCRTLTAVLKVYGDAGEVERALGLFEQCDADGMVMDVICFNTLMGPVLKKDDPETVLELFSRMESRGVEPDSLTMSLVLKAAEQAGAAEWAWLLMEKMREEGGVIAMQVYADGIRACCVKTRTIADDDDDDDDDDDNGEGVESEEGLVESSIEAAILDNAADSTPLRRAMSIFIEARQVYEGENIGRLYAGILLACARDERAEGADAARSLLDEMRHSKFPPDKASFGPAASALASAGDWEEAIEVLKEGAAMGALPNNIAYEDIRAAAHKEGKLKVANEGLHEIIYPEADPAAADASSTND
ncbi:unnamed protein product [Ectocarpus sp. 12 AP-2014]